METNHPGEIELAVWDDVAGAERAAHLRRCAPCRNRVADYRRLTGEVTAALNIAAGAVRPPRPQWNALRARMCAAARREVRARASALACAMLLTCALCIGSAATGLGAWAAQPARSENRRAHTVPAETALMVTLPYGVGLPASATPTPAVSQADPITPAPLLPPTPVISHQGAGSPQLVGDSGAASPTSWGLQ